MDAAPEGGHGAGHREPVDSEKLRVMMGLGTPLDEATWSHCLQECPDLGAAPPGAVYTNLRALSQLLALGGEQLRTLVGKAPALLLVDAGHVQEEMDMLEVGLQLDRAGVVALVTSQPRVLTLRGDLLGLRIAGLKQLLASSPSKLTQIVAKHPNLLLIPQTALEDKLGQMAGLLGVSPQVVLERFASNPALLSRSIEAQRASLAGLASLLQLPKEAVVKLVLRNPRLAGQAAEGLTAKLATLAQVLQQPEEAVRHLLAKQPDLLLRSVASTQAKLDAYAATFGAGAVPRMVGACPQLLTLSEEHVGSKWALLQQLASLEPHWRAQLGRAPPAQLAQWMCLSEGKLRRLQVAIGATEIQALTLSAILGLPEARWEEVLASAGIQPPGEGGGGGGGGAAGPSSRQAQQGGGGGGSRPAAAAQPPAARANGVATHGGGGEWGAAARPAAAAAARAPGTALTFQLLLQKLSHPHSITTIMHSVNTTQLTRRATGRDLARPAAAPAPRGTSRCPKALTFVPRVASHDMTIAVDGGPSGLGSCYQPTCAAPILMSALAVFGAAYWFKLQVEARKSFTRVPEPWPEIPLLHGDSLSYQRALSRTRQAQHITKATTLMKAGEPSRAMVELKRALVENEVCRSPLLDGHQKHEELVGLYKLHLKYGEVPPSFPILLQLREMLGLTTNEADDIEAQVMMEGCCFCI